jgi:hypothetical protein
LQMQKVDRPDQFGYRLFDLIKQVQLVELIDFQV